MLIANGSKTQTSLNVLPSWTLHCFLVPSYRQNLDPPWGKVPFQVVQMWAKSTSTSGKKHIHRPNQLSITPRDAQSYFSSIPGTSAPAGLDRPDLPWTCRWGPQWPLNNEFIYSCLRTRLWVRFNPLSRWFFSTPVYICCVSWGQISGSFNCTYKECC